MNIFIYWGLTCARGAVGVVAGVWGCSVASKAGVALTVRARRVACCATELRGAAAGANRTLAWKEPTSNCGMKQTKLSLTTYYRSLSEDT